MKTSDVSIRSGRIEDAEAVCRVIKDSVTNLCQLDHHNDPAEISEWLSNKTSRNMEIWIDRNTTFCAIDDHESIIGVSMVSPNQEILLNYVMPNYARQGIGTRMLKEIEASCPTGTLISVQSTLSALYFYQHRGFTNSENSSNLLIKRI